MAHHPIPNLAVRRMDKYLQASDEVASLLVLVPLASLEGLLLAFLDMAHTDLALQHGVDTLRVKDFLQISFRLQACLWGNLVTNNTLESLKRKMINR
jgi:hypothetical protein